MKCFPTKVVGRKMREKKWHSYQKLALKLLDKWQLLTWRALRKFCWREDLEMCSLNIPSDNENSSEHQLVNRPVPHSWPYLLFTKLHDGDFDYTFAPRGETESQEGTAPLRPHWTGMMNSSKPALCFFYPASFKHILIHIGDYKILNTAIYFYISRSRIYFFGW